jgi:hypothetical protein
MLRTTRRGRQSLSDPDARDDVQPGAAHDGAVRSRRCNPGMTDRELLDEVRRMRAAGAPPKAIARALGVRPSVIMPLVRRVAAEAPAASPERAELIGCWVSPGWSRELLVQRRAGWEDVDLGPAGPTGIVLVLVARAGRRDRVSVCGYLVDTFCLGVKNALGPEPMRRRDLPAFARAYFNVFPAPALGAPIDLAQHLVHGAVAFASTLGFAPHPDFAAVRGHLGELREPCAITFGREGRPLYVAGPYDDPIAVMERLRAALGGVGFAVAA